MEKWWPVVGALVVLLISGVVIWRYKKAGGVVAPGEAPRPSISIVPTGEQLLPAQQPKVTLKFERDGHYVLVVLDNLHADSMEYNLVYDATVKGNKIQTGVNASKNIKGQTTISQRQLLGSESSGKFTYHDNIRKAYMDLVLRDATGRSIFTATYPFDVRAGKNVELKASE